MLQQVYAGQGIAHLPPPSLVLNYLTESLDGRPTFAGGSGGTRFNSAGTQVSAANPVIDYDPVTLACKGLMGKPQRTNSATFSDSFRTPNWGNTNCLVTDDQAIAPNGAMAADLVVSSAGVVGFVTKNIAHTAGTTYTATVWMKAAGRTSFNILANGSQLWADTFHRTANFTLTGAGVATQITTGGNSSANASCSIIARPNGWYRCSMTYKPDLTATSGVQIRDAAAGDGVNGVYLWRALAEQASFAGPDIPSTNAAVTVTAHDTTLTGAAFAAAWNPDADVGNTVVVDFETIALTTNEVYWGICGPAGLNDSVYISNSGGGNLSLSVIAGGVNQTSFNFGAAAANTRYRVALSLKENEITARVNGGAEFLDTLAARPTCDRMGILRAPWTLGVPPYAYMRQIIIRPGAHRSHLQRLSAI